MKKLLIFTALILFSLSAAAYAATYEQLYDCLSPDEGVIGGIVPGKVREEKDCKSFEKSKSVYTYCIQTAREKNIKTLALYNQGKCKKSKMRISGVFENTECSFLYDEKGRVVTGYTSTSGKTGEACLSSLAKELKNKYPNITATLPDLTKYGFTY